MSTTFAPASWTEIDDRLTVGNAGGNYAGLIEHLNGRYIATDARGNVIGTFDTRREAQASLEPGSLEKTLELRRRRQSILEAAAGIAAVSTTIIALAGLATAGVL